MTYLTVLQTKVCHTSHWRSLPLREVFINLINTIRDMVVRLVKQLASGGLIENDVLEQLNDPGTFVA